jgi:small subunit ribosomal protein S6e
MKQGVLINGRVKILMRGRVSLYRQRRSGERKRKSCRGCIIGSDISVIALRILIKGDGEVEGLTDAERPRRLGPKRAAHIRKAFVLRKTDDVRKYIVRRPREARASDGKVFYKAANIQRLITEKRVRRKVVAKNARVNAWKANKEAHVSYEKLLSKYLKEKKAAKKAAEPTPVAPVKAAPAKAAPAKAAAKAAPAKAAPAKAAPAAPVKAGKTGKK